MGNCDAEIDCEVDRVIDQILQEDRLESMGLDPRPDPCAASCEDADEEPSKNCAIETSARFSIRILEALRAVQRQKATHTSSWPSCTMQEIVRYIRRHYHYDGDLCSQVETALDQVTAQGFVLKMGVNRYHLMGPFACSVAKPPKIGNCSNRDRRNCGVPKSSRGRRRRSCTPNANSTFAVTDLNSASFSLDRLSTVSEIGNPQPDAFRNRNNRARSLMRDDGRPFNEDQEISILEEIHPPDQRAGCIQGQGCMPRDESFDENAEEMVPNQQIRRPGGGGRGRVVQDRSFGENLEEIHPPVPNERIGRLGHCDDPEEVVQDHQSSDENMFCVEPTMNDTRRRRRRRESSSSGSSGESVISKCPARSSRRKNRNCSSDADVSDDTDVDDRESGKPWVRNCQNQENRMFKRRGRRCSSCVDD